MPTNERNILLAESTRTIIARTSRGWLLQILRKRFEPAFSADETIACGRCRDTFAIDLSCPTTAHRDCSTSLNQVY